MILKVQSDDGGFRLWDSLYNVHISKGQMVIMPDPEEDCPNVEQFSRINQKTGKGDLMGEPQHVINVNHRVMDDGDVVHRGWIVTAEHGDGGFSIFFDTTGYLLNDEGKTIEVLR